MPAEIEDSRENQRKNLASYLLPGFGDAQILTECQPRGNPSLGGGEIARNKEDCGFKELTVQG